MGQKYAAYNTSGSIIAYYDSVDSPPPSTATVIPITEEEWQTCLSAPGYTVANEVLTAPTAAWIAAQAALVASQPNPQGFIAAVKTALGGPVGILGLGQTLQNAIMLTITAISEGNYADAQAIIISQETALGATLYGDIKAAVKTYNLPITLP